MKNFIAGASYENRSNSPSNSSIGSGGAGNTINLAGLASKEKSIMSKLIPQKSASSAM